MWAPRGNAGVDRGGEPAVERLTWESGPSPPLCHGPKGYELTRSNLDRCCGFGLPGIDQRERERRPAWPAVNLAVAPWSAT